MVRVGQTEQTSGIGGGGYDAGQKLDFLRQLMPSIDAKRLDDGRWQVNATPMMERMTGPIAQSQSFEAKTKDGAIDQAFRWFTEGAPLVVHGFASSAKRIEVRWQGNGWEILKGQLPGTKPTANGTGSLGAAEKRVLGQVGNQETVPQRTIVGVYHKGQKPTSNSQQMLARGFEADKAGNHDKALRDYELAFAFLRQEVVGKFGKELQARGVDADWLLLNDNPVVFKSVLREAGIFESSTETRDTFKMYLNRTGLAIKHKTAAEKPEKAREEYGFASMMIEMALELDPKYGAAHYNNACIALVGFGETGLALDGLERAIADPSFDFKKLARENDTDWNGIRNDPRFRQLVGLPSI
jgi:hypothetical protein